MSKASTAIAAAQRDAQLSPELFDEAMGAQVIFTLPSGERRPAIIAYPIDATRADIRVICRNHTDGEFFHGHWGIEPLLGAPYSENHSKGCWSFHLESELRTRWPN